MRALFKGRATKPSKLRARYVRHATSLSNERKSAGVTNYWISKKLIKEKTLRLGQHGTSVPREAKSSTSEPLLHREGGSPPLAELLAAESGNTEKARTNN